MKRRYFIIAVAVMAIILECTITKAAKLEKKTVTIKIRDDATKNRSRAQKFKCSYDFFNVRPQNKDFKGKNLSNHNLSGSNFCEVDFTEADFSNALFNHYTNFEDACLVNIKNKTINPHDDGSLTPEQAYNFFIARTPHIARVTWSDNYKNKGDLFVGNQQDFVGKNLAYCDLRGTSFEGVNLMGADLTNVELWGGSTSFKGANLKNIKHRVIKPSGQPLTKDEIVHLLKDLYGCDITDAVLE